MSSYIDECNVYIRFSVPCGQVDPEVARLLFGQFGGLQQLSMRPEQNFAFATYEKPKYAIYVCEMLNGVEFMGAPLTVKPRDRTKNFDKFRESKWSQANNGYRNYRPTYYEQLSPMEFADFEVETYLEMERIKNEMEEQQSSRS